MPPTSSSRRKRRSDDMAETVDDDDTTPAPPATTTPRTGAKRKLTKQEKAEARERARLAMGSTPSATTTPKPVSTATKRRKLNTSTTPGPPSKRPAASASKSKTPAGKTTTPASAATTSKKASKADKIQEARERAAQWAEEEQRKKAAKKGAPTPVAAPAPAPIPVAVQQPAPVSAPASIGIHQTTTATSARTPAPATANIPRTSPYRPIISTGSPSATRQTTPFRATTTSVRSLGRGSLSSSLRAQSAASRANDNTIAPPPVTMPKVSAPSSSRSSNIMGSGILPPSTTAMAVPPAAMPSSTSDNTMRPPSATLPRVTATGQQTKEVDSPDNAFTMPVLQQPAAAPISPTLVQPSTTIIPTHMDTGVVAPRRAVATPQDRDDQTELSDEDEDMGAEFASAKSLKSKWVFGGILAALSIAFLSRLVNSIKYNPKSGMLMVMGNTPVPYPRKNEAYAVADAAGELAKAQTCYDDSPASTLESISSEILASVTEPAHCPNGFVPCPPNAVCWKGNWIGCKSPVWEFYESISIEGNDDKTTRSCILSQAVNETYQNVVNLMEEWSIHHLCFNHVDVPTPVSFYSQNSSDPTGLVIASTENSASSVNSIPLYQWKTIFRMLEGPEVLEDVWDWDLLRTANLAHQQLVLEDSVEPSVGLAPSRYWFTEATKLGLACKVSRRMTTTLNWIGDLCWNVVMGLASAIWFCLRRHPLWTLAITASTSLFLFIRQRRLKHQRLLKQVDQIRRQSLAKLKSALHANPGDGMRQGEVAVMHLRDHFAWELHGDDDDHRREFTYEVWPRVVAKINRDNRVRKSHRVVGGGVKRDLWMWVATDEE